MSAQWLPCGGVRLYVEERGRHGAPVLLLHGFTGSVLSMASVARGLEGRHRVYSLDLVGHGRSDAPATVECYRIPACVDQIAAALDTLAIGPVHLLGYSMGARVALALALRYPPRVQSLLLVGGSAGLAVARERMARVEADGLLARRLRAEGLGAFVDHWMAQPLFASQRRLGQDFLDAARAQRLENSAEALALSLEGMGAGAMAPLQDQIHRLRMPVLLVAGAEDAKYCRIARELAALIPQAEVAILDGAGHAAHLEQSQAFCALALNFYARHGVGPHGGPAGPPGRGGYAGGPAVVDE